MHLWSVVSLFGLVVSCAGGGGSGGGGSECSSSYTCGWNQVCQAQSCQDIFGRKFRFTVMSGSASTSVDWDAGGGAPDPYVVLDLDGDTCSTPTEQDTFYPQWSYACDLVVDEGGHLSVDMYDDDLSIDDLMLTFSASGSDDLASAVQDGGLSLSASSADLDIAIEPNF